MESDRGGEVEETVGNCSGVEGDTEGSLVLVHTERGQGKVELAAMVRAPCCMVATHRPGVFRWGILSNTCRVTVWIEWNAILGSLQAELDLCPKTKFALLLTLSNID